MSGGFQQGPGVCNGTSVGFDAANTRGTAVVGANGSYGSYTQLTASTAADTSFIMIELASNASSNSGFGGGAKIAVGAAASEVDIIVDLQVSAPSGNYYTASYVFPIAIPSGTRVSAAFNSNGGTDTCYVNIVLFDSNFTSSEFQHADSIGATNSGSRGTQVTAGAANTKGSYTQLTASTPRDYSAIGLTVCDFGAAALINDRISVDVAIGAGGSEVIILPDLFYGNNNIVQSIGINTVFCIPVEVPSATRVAARLQSVTGSNSYGILLHGLY